MKISDLIECLRCLNVKNIKDGNYMGFLESNLTKNYEKLGITYEDLLISLKNIISLNFSKEVDLEWKYICQGFYIIKLLSKEAKTTKEVFLSVQETKDLKIFIQNLVVVGICTRLQPNLSFYIKSNYFNSNDIFWNYNVLKCTIFGLIEFLKTPILRLAILPESLKEILVGLYQICYCPLKKPTECTKVQNNDLITKEIYEILVKEKQLFLNILNQLRETIHPNIFVKETMLIFHMNSPTWFKKQISHNLTDILRSKNGIQTVAVALFGDYENNICDNWKMLDVFSKLIVDCKRFPDFQENTCKQLIFLLQKESHKQSIVEKIFAQCTKTLYAQDPKLCKDVLIQKVLMPFIYFTYKSHKFKDEDITENFKLTSRMLHAIFVENTCQDNVPPSDMLKPIINIIFKFYVLTTDTSHKTENNDLKDVLLLFFENQQGNHNNVFDTLLFDIESADILLFRNDVGIIVDKSCIKVKKSELPLRYSSSKNCECMYKLLKPKPKQLVLFFGFLLKCIQNESIYFPKRDNALTEIEDELIDLHLKEKLVVYNLLSELANKKMVQNQLSENPQSIIDYMNDVLKKTLEQSTHLTDEYESDSFQSVFTILMILQNVLENSSMAAHNHFKVLIEPLKQICIQTNSKETKDILENILRMLHGHKVGDPKKVEEARTELDKIIDDVCDPLLPTRGHGLICLTKLIKKKSKYVYERKHFVLNILQQNITNNDSFIYLSAINGLAAMADIFPDTILNILCEEYSISNRKDTDDYLEIRMKVGEVLIKATNTLGDMAPKYKSLLLNTFLLGAKDDDYLIRSSSLSNLGEICRVLGYKLGSMFTEVLVCVHAVISTDKSIEARRAAVTVIRQLFLGLDQDIISIFKEEILPVYRTLKRIYDCDKDDVMRLQAQLALEDLNESMKTFVFPNPRLDFGKKIFKLN